MTSMMGQETTHVVHRATRGDPAATEALLAEYRPRLVRYFRARLGRIGGTYTTADDLAQEVCIGILRALPCYQDRGKPFSAFVFAVAANKVADAKRAAFRASTVTFTDKPPEKPDPTATCPEQAAVNAELARRLAGYLEQLPATQREIVVLRIGVGLTADEVGTILGMTAAAVRMAQSRALTRLRQLANNDPENAA